MNSSAVLTCYLKYTITFIVIQHGLQYNVHDSDSSGVYTNRTHIVFKKKDKKDKNNDNGVNCVNSTLNMGPLLDTAMERLS